MPVPFRQSMRIGRYIFAQKLARRERFPLLVELEPLYQCNLACAGCGKIQQPDELLRRRMPVADAIAAIEESGAPMVSIAAIASATGMRRRSSSSGCWILPHPAQARLHW